MGPSKSIPYRPPPDWAVQNKFGGASWGCLAHSLLLYHHLLQDPDIPVSWQVGTTVAALSERVDAPPVDGATAEALDDLRSALKSGLESGPTKPAGTVFDRLEAKYRHMEGGTGK